VNGADTPIVLGIFASAAVLKDKRFVTLKRCLQHIYSCHSNKGKVLTKRFYNRAIHDHFLRLWPHNNAAASELNKHEKQKHDRSKTP
jgi:hypothetical protein